MEKQMIHIHAKCNRFEIFEVIPADKAVSRIKQIKSLSKNKSIGQYTWNKRPHPDNDYLVVNTVIINPTLFAV